MCAVQIWPENFHRTLVGLRHGVADQGLSLLAHIPARSYISSTHERHNAQHNGSFLHWFPVFYVGLIKTFDRPLLGEIRLHVPAQAMSRDEKSAVLPLRQAWQYCALQPGRRLYSGLSASFLPWPTAPSSMTS